MKLTRMAVVLLLSIVLISTLACGSSSTSKPTATPTATPTPTVTASGIPEADQLKIETHWPEVQPLIEQKQFARTEIITNSGKELYIFAFSPDPDVAERAVDWIAVIIPELESFFGVDFIQSSYPEGQFAVAIYLPLSLPSGEPAGLGGIETPTIFGMTFSFRLLAEDGWFNLYTLIREISHSFTIARGPSWWWDGASAGYPAHKLYPVLIEKLNCFDNQWPHAGPGYFNDPTDYSTKEEWLTELYEYHDVLNYELASLTELEKQGVMTGSCGYYADHQGTALLYELEGIIGLEGMKDFFRNLNLVYYDAATNEQIIEAAVSAAPQDQKEYIENLFRAIILGD